MRITTKQFLEKNDNIYKHQFGFKKGYSTEQAILEITDNLNSAINTNKLLVAYSSISEGHLKQLNMIFCSLNYIIMESVEPHLNVLKAIYAIALNL